MAAIQNSQAAKQRKVGKVNFSASELVVLTEEVEENMFVLKSKFTDSVTNARKNKIWADITAAVNAVGVANGGVVQRRCYRIFFLYSVRFLYLDGMPASNIFSQS